jgi:hypothetical protein
MWYLLTAYSVISVFGAAVPLGMLAILWIAGLARQSLPGVQGGPPSAPDCGPLPQVGSSWLHVLGGVQIISRRRTPASPGRMVMMSVPGAIWLALIP